MQISWAARSHPGVRRRLNEDSYCARPDLGLFVVADGMGGHTAGEVASRIAAEAIEAFVQETTGIDKNDTWPFPFEPAMSLDANRLKSAFRMANRRLATRMSSDQGLRGMATTATAILLRSAAVVAHVGDSRAYLMRGGRMQRLTADHSWVEDQVRAGTLSASAAREHPWRNVVTRALTGQEDVQIDLVEVKVRSNDKILLCSDGLTSVVPDDRIGEILAEPLELAAICDALVSAANSAGGPDNVTALVLAIDVP